MSYAALEKHFTQISALEGASSMLGWDTETMMPEGAMPVRAEQCAALAEVIHERTTDTRISGWLDEAKSEQNLSTWQQANVREIEREYLHANALPADLVGAFSKATLECEHVWRDARPKNDFEAFLPSFEKVIKLVQEIATIKSELLNLSAYDALLDGYDPGMRSEHIDGYFADLKDFLPNFLDNVLSNQPDNTSAISHSVPVDLQEKLGRDMMKALGFDFKRGRIDVSAHPFCGGVPGDVRLTTRYSEDQFTESLYGVLHETGHALYEMGLPEEWLFQPVGRARGMSLHESQSLLVEMQLCRSKDFLVFALPKMKSCFGDIAKDWQLGELYQSLSRVERSLIRVNADEVTYPLHVMLRYDLEKALLSGDLKPADLPSAWDEKMQELVGITPDCVGNGCMQDVHWPGGAIGYFPTYTIGAMIAAQIFDAARQAIPDFTHAIHTGDFEPLFSWLKENVHGKASLYGTQELLKEATGQPLNTAIYKAHLKQRYIG
ncbi:MAG: carboxypeptidase M32 [Rickettsiales bacterium]|nr:carboxypeptidase M32 [Rickettsiales bacterium]